MSSTSERTIAKHKTVAIAFLHGDSVHDVIQLSASSTFRSIRGANWSVRSLSEAKIGFLS